MAREGTTKARGRKHALDKFYTKSNIAADCLAILDLKRYARVIEPSAGGGAFSDHLFSDPSLNVLAFDLEPENPLVLQQDWFAYNVVAPGDTLVVGNPPFGTQCNLAVRFINHAFEVVEAQTVAFILPRSFRKASLQARVFPHAQLTHEVILPANSFELEGKDYELNTVFQVWERSATRRKIRSVSSTSSFFTFTKKSETHDFAIRRVGGKAGHAFKDSADTSEQSNYFIKLNKRRNVSAVIAMVNGIDFSVADDGTGPRTLSKGELVDLFDKAYRKRFAA